VRVAVDVRDRTAEGDHFATECNEEGLVTVGRGGVMGGSST
jgi:hypothetical protein